MSPMIPSGKQQHSRVNIDKARWLGGLVNTVSGTIFMAGCGAVTT